MKNVYRSPREQLRWVAYSRYVSDRFFFWKSVGGITDTFESTGMFNISVLKDVLSLKMGKSVAETVRKHVPDERAAQMIDHFTQYVGSSPEASPAVLCGIAHMQTEEGGMRANTKMPIADVLSSFTGMLTLADLGALHEIDTDRARKFVLEQQMPTGGLRAAAWDEVADVEYTFYGLGCLALLAKLQPGG